MTLETRRKVVATVVAVLAIWPACHFAVVRAYDLNPWNWFGWAMYTLPAQRVEAFAYSPDGKPVSPASMSRDAYQRIQIAYHRWSRRMIEVDWRGPPLEFAREILSAYPSWPEVKIRAHRIGMDRESATMMIQATETYRLSREDVGLESSSSQVGS